MNDLETIACTPTPIRQEHLNPDAQLPYALSLEHIYYAMKDFLDFLGFLNHQLSTKNIARLETMLMPANFSGLVGEFMVSAIPKYCLTLVKNAYPNGHPDLLPQDMFADNAILHTTQGIEIKASRYPSAWQGHNPEEVWLLIFVFKSNRPQDKLKNNLPTPFQFVKVVGAPLLKSDWSFSGRSATSRRTITATVNRSGYAKLEANWIYRSVL